MRMCRSSPRYSASRRHSRERFLEFSNARAEDECGIGTHFLKDGRTSSRRPARWAFKSMNGTATRVAEVPVSIVVSANFRIVPPNLAGTQTQSCRAASDHGPRSHILPVTTAGPDQRFTDCEAAENDGPGPDRCSLHTRVTRRSISFGLRFACRRCSRVAVINEHHAMPDEHLVFDRDALANERVAGDQQQAPTWRSSGSHE